MKYQPLELESINTLMDDKFIFFIIKTYTKKSSILYKKFISTWGKLLYIKYTNGSNIYFVTEKNTVSIKQYQDMVKGLLIKKTISFEGIDATGKGTLSKNLNNFLNNLGFLSKRINVPDYNTPSGNILKQCLSKKYTDDDLYDTLLEFANHFGVNRGFIKYDIENNTRPDFLLFDRWVNSSVAFSIGKILNYFKYTDKIEIDTIKKYPDLYEKINNINSYIHTFEYEILKNYKPDLEIVLYADIDKIITRIKNRRELLENNGDNDVHEYDAHEDKIHLLNYTQEVYKKLLVLENNQLFIDTTDKDTDEIFYELMNTLLKF